MIRLTMTAIGLAVAGVALAKLPPPDEAAKAKAAEAASKTAWQAKVDGYKLCVVQDRIASKYKSNHPEPRQPAVAPAGAGTTAAPAGATMTPTAAPAGAATPGAASTGTAATSAATTAAPAAKPPAPTSASASQGGSTPVAVVAAPNAAPTPPCTDPGPFTTAAATPAAQAPASQKPLESSEAHSPPATATSPPSVRPESGTMTSGKTGAAPKK
jgi:hypothetical protein